ncbi:hypothetical protein [Azospirillum canadense]|uniref:hypothetical protein n=1 Tax=Azospirillum canadense TaxID=403962 RepID=UPI0022277E60|nr:hypothetical protein [Azospirillum canadense]MCW2241355.1 hypothetical protein [Azospirillum canadense]
MRKIALASFAVLALCAGAAQAGSYTPEIQFDQFKQSGQFYKGYWSVWAENNADLFGGIQVMGTNGITEQLKAATQVVGAVNDGKIDSTFLVNLGAGALITQTGTNTGTNTGSNTAGELSQSLGLQGNLQGNLQLAGIS